MDKVIEISQDDIYLSIYRNFLRLQRHQEKLAQIDLDEIGSIIITAHQSSLSKNIIDQCAKRHIPIMICDQYYMPSSLTLPITSHYQQQAILHAQINCTLPFKKRLWQKIIQQKITAQAVICKKLHDNQSAQFLYQLSKKVKSGDISNHEAQAARYYWQKIMGCDFRRKTQNASDNRNIMLNYGYAVLRASVARAIIGVGLHPALGVHHHNQLNPFCLVDDMMEVYRPIIDYHVVHYSLQYDNLNSEAKKHIVDLLILDLDYQHSKTPLYQAIKYSALSLKQAIMHKNMDLSFAYLPL